MNIDKMAASLAEYVQNLVKEAYNEGYQAGFKSCTCGRQSKVPIDWHSTGGRVEAREGASHG